MTQPGQWTSKSNLQWGSPERATESVSFWTLIEDEGTHQSEVVKGVAPHSPPGRDVQRSEDEMVEHEVGDKPGEDLTAALEQIRRDLHLKLVPDLAEVEAEPVVGSHVSLFW